MRRRTSTIAILVIAVTVSTGWVASRVAPDARAPIQIGASLLAPDIQDAAFTDWEAIRETLEAAGNARPAAFLTAARERDLSVHSLLANNAVAMQDAYGWSPATIEWEMYGANTKRILLTAGMGASDSGEAITDRLRKLGYEHHDDMWSLDSITFAGLGAKMPDVLQNIVVLGDERLILASSSASNLAAALHRHRGGGRSLGDVRSVRDILAAVAGATNASIKAKRSACEQSSLADTDAADKTRAKNVLAPLGRLVPINRMGQALYAGGGDDGGGQRVRYAMAFDSAVQASGQARIRSALATGPIIGRVTAIEDFMKLGSTHTRGTTAILDFHVSNPTDSALTQIGSGPMLFAACAAVEKSGGPFD